MKRRAVLLGLLALVLVIEGGVLWCAFQEGPTAWPGRRGTGPADAAAIRNGESASGVTPDASGDPSASRADARRPRWHHHGNGTLIGRLVERATERPVANATVTLTAGRSGPRKSPVAHTDHEGRFAFPCVAAFDDWVLTAELPRPLASARVTGIEVGADSQTDLGVVYVGTGLALDGVVVTAAGSPIAGALVRAVPRGPGTTGVNVLQALRDLAEAPAVIDETKTTEDGRFVLTRVPQGTCDLIASAAGYGIAVSHAVIVAPNRRDPRLRLVLHEGFALAGKVVHRSGGNVAGLRVTAFSESLDVNGLHLPDKVLGITDDDGGFRLEGLARLDGHDDHMVCVTQANGVRTIRGDNEIEDGELVEITIGGETSVEGTVTDQNGEPVAGAEIMLNLDVRKRTMVFAVTRTGADGRYRLADLPVAEVEGYIVTAEGFASFPSHELALVTQESETRLDIVPGRNVLDIRLDGSKRVRGVVVAHGTGRPVPGVRVTLIAGHGKFDPTPSVLTDASGAFEIPGAGDDDDDIILWKEGWATVGDDARQQPDGGSDADAGIAPSARDGERVRVFTMSRSVRARGRVLAPEGTPVSGARVTLHPAGAAHGGGAGSRVARGLPPQSLTDARGEFVLTGVGTNGQHMIHAAAEGYLPACSAPLIGAAAEDMEDIDVVLRLGAVLEVVVTRPDGVPIEEAGVRWSRRAPGSTPRDTHHFGTPAGWTNADGVFRAENLEPGILSATATHERYLKSGRHEIEAAEGETVRLHIVLVRTGVISGVVLGPHGTPYSGAVVYMDPRPHRSPSSRRTDHSGYFEFVGVDNGSHRFRAHARGTACSEIVTASVGGRPVTLRLRPDSPISGTVLFADGTPAVGARVTVRQTPARKSRDDSRTTRLPEGAAADGVRIVPVPPALPAIPNQERSTRVAEDGTFSIRGLLAGSYELRVKGGQSRKRPSVNMLPLTVRGVAAGTSHLDLRVERGASITGSVFLADGKPAHRGTAHAVSVGSSDDDARAQGPAIKTSIRFGAFELICLRRGLVRVTVRVGEQAVAVTVPSGTQDLRIDLPETGAIQGRVLLPDGDEAAEVRIIATGSGARSSTTTDDEGRFTLRGLSVGTYTLHAEFTLARAPHTATRAHVVVTPSGTTDVADLLLRRGSP